MGPLPVRPPQLLRRPAGLPVPPDLRHRRTVLTRGNDMTLIDTLQVAPPARRRIRGPFAVLIAVAALAAAAGLVGGVRAATSRDTSAPLFLDWPARGSLRDDTA